MQPGRPTGSRRGWNLNSFAFAALLLWPAFGHTAELPAIGETVVGHLELMGKQVTLPPGEWRVASTGFGRADGGEDAAYGAIGGAMLLRPTPGSPGEFLLVHTNALPVRGGWGQPLECTSNDTLFRFTAEERDHLNSCGFVVATRAGSLRRSGLPALAGLRDNPAAAADLPTWALVAGYRVSDRADMLDIRYGIAPGVPDPAVWFGGETERDDSHARVIARLSDWLNVARQVATADLRDPHPQVPPAPPLPLAPGRSEPVVVKPEDLSTMAISFLKLATYRMMASSSSFILALALGNDLTVSAVLTFWSGLTHSVVYLANELAWEWPPTTPATILVAARSASPPTIAIPAAAPARATMLTIDGKQMPLPNGPWTELSRQTVDGVTGVVLGRVDGQALLALAVVHANQKPSRDIFGAPPECGSSTAPFATIRYDTPVDGFCVYGNIVRPGMNETGNPLWTAALARLQADRVQLPTDLLMVGARARTQHNFLDARFYFRPFVVAEANGAAPGAEAGQLRLQALRAWGDLLQAPMELGVRGRLADGSAPLSEAWPLDKVEAAIDTQTRGPLARLRRVGMLDDAGYGQQLALAVRAASLREQQRWSLWERTFYKVATYRVAAYADSVAVSWIVTASTTQAFAFASINALIKPAMNYGNEIFWAASGVGKPKAALASASFPEIGSTP